MTSMPSNKYETLELKIKNIKTVELPNGCIVPEKMSVDAGGYPQTTWKQNPYRVTRLVVAMKEGLDYRDQSWVTRHSNQCVTKTCINPSHLQSGTIADNLREAAEAGRMGIRYNNEIKLQAVAMRAAGHTWSEIRNVAGCTTDTIKRWISASQVA